MTNENYDATWYQYERREETIRYGESDKLLAEMMALSYARDMPTKFGSRTNIIAAPPPIRKPSYPGLKIQETPVPAKTAQQEIDDAVREAIEKPKREAEIAKRVAAVQALTPDTYDVGTVIKFKRQYGKTTYTFAALKVEGDKWFVTGSTLVSSAGWNWTNLVEWMTTGENLVTDVVVSSGEWTTVLA